MLFHYAYGIIPLQFHSGRSWLLIVKRKEGFWEFPKGHANEGETAWDTAKRELQEETGLTIATLLSPVPFTIQYNFSISDSTGDATVDQFVQKAVNYFLAEVEGTVQLNPEEVISSQWVKADEAAHHLTYDSSKDLCAHVLEFLKEKNLGGVEEKS